MTSSKTKVCMEDHTGAFCLRTQFCARSINLNILPYIMFTTQMKQSTAADLHARVLRSFILFFLVEYTHINSELVF